MSLSLDRVQPGAVVIAHDQKMFLVLAQRTTYGIKAVLLSHGSKAYKIYSLNPSEKVHVHRQAPAHRI